VKDIFHPVIASASFRVMSNMAIKMHQIYRKIVMENQPNKDFTLLWSI
jgi:hypothetical protein